VKAVKEEKAMVTPTGFVITGGMSRPVEITATKNQTRIYQRYAPTDSKKVDQ
jgi:hypothetical protein